MIQEWIFVGIDVLKLWFDGYVYFCGKCFVVGSFVKEIVILIWQVVVLLFVVVGLEVLGGYECRLVDSLYVVGFEVYILLLVCVWSFVCVVGQLVKIDVIDVVMIVYYLEVIYGWFKFYVLDFVCVRLSMLVVYCCCLVVEKSGLVSQFDMIDEFVVCVMIEVWCYVIVQDVKVFDKVVCDLFIVMLYLCEWYKCLCQVVGVGLIFVIIILVDLFELGCVLLKVVVVFFGVVLYVYQFGNIN